mmetsp:Transcript_534/g.1826  ORF Transcript_534/g.1826 Transcript_534/m.1826 type:complete len:282 (+) Transcript_534:561-1406(+)
MNQHRNEHATETSLVHNASVLPISNGPRRIVARVEQLELTAQVADEEVERSERIDEGRYCGVDAAQKGDHHGQRVKLEVEKLREYPVGVPVLPLCLAPEQEHEVAHYESAGIQYVERIADQSVQENVFHHENTLFGDSDRELLDDQRRVANDDIQLLQNCSRDYDVNKVGEYQKDVEEVSNSRLNERKCVDLLSVQNLPEDQRNQLQQQHEQQRRQNALHESKKNAVPRDRKSLQKLEPWNLGKSGKVLQCLDRHDDQTPEYGYEYDQNVPNDRNWLSAAV